ncbi:carboxylate--amine ligase [Desulfuribacillus stibiiarsenatis]|uniref:Carboxylate--amine ligase n=1 Tax=Desulfuribacillus stibiiarsenatis TaxID=1390249 RepID=A0A1E5L464_9FIRM|nr:ATP-grasp domain-containing protein [Desulfuribacillus stibiiarsenatis]OEH84907.1 carboxylate--amine ligase [Desulfuribacillus stibiiarsenatis]
MNVVMFSPHFPKNFQNFCLRLKAHGANVFGIADVSSELLEPSLQQSFTEYFQVSDLHNYDEILRICGYITYKYGKIDRIESHNEYWLEQDADLRTDFNVPGIKADDIAYYKKKSLMKELFRKAKVPHAKGKVVETIEDAQAFIEEVDYPVVVKPDIGVGAANTYRLDNSEQLVQFFATKDSREYIMEEFIEGGICSFDGLVDQDGNLVFYTGHQYSQGIMETVNEDRHVSYYSYRDLPEDLKTLGLRLLKSFKVRERFFHFEFFRTPKSKLLVLEVNMRPPGGLTMDMFNYACDIDLYDVWTRMLTNQLDGLDYERKYHCCYIGRKFKHSYRYSHENILEHYGSKIAYHEPINSIFGAALGDYGYLVRSESLEELQEVVNYIQDTTDDH